MENNAVSHKKKRKGFIVFLVLFILAAAAAVWFFFFRTPPGDGTEVFVMSVAEITGSGLANTQNRFAGVVESQETQDINIAQGREVKDIFVAVGDLVEAGDELFSYTTEDIDLKMQQVSIEIEGLYNSITTSRTQIAELEKEKAAAPEESQIDFTLQIQAAIAQIAQTEYNIKTKQVEYDQLKKSFDNSVVTAALAGSVQSVNEDGATDQYTGQSLPFMVIMQGGDFLLKGTVSELNVSAVSPGMRVKVRSRTDEEMVWGGTVTELDTTQTQDDQNNVMYYGPGTGGASASKYSFYVELDSMLGLMIGQHVTIEADLGQGSAEGLWLSPFYILEPDNGGYVWADNGRDRVEKRELTLGAFDEMLGYEILGGLDTDDYIAFPDEFVSAGMPTTREYAVPEEDMGGGMMASDGGAASADMPAPIIGGQK